MPFRPLIVTQMLTASLRSLKSPFDVAQQLAEDTEAGPHWLCVAIKGSESSSQFRWFTIAKIALQFLIFFVLILGLRLQR